MTTGEDPVHPERPPRTTELVAAAATGGLDDREREEYAALVAADPTLADEVEELRRVLGHLDDAPTSWAEPEPSPGLEARVIAIADGAGEPLAGTPPATSGTPAVASAAPRRPRRWLPLAAAAVAFVAGGLAGGTVVGAVLGDEDAPPQGPPGTLGAVEPIDFEGEPDGVDIDATLVAHTWGTETVLDTDGWERGARYQVVLVGQDGSVEDSGTFVGSEVPMLCHLNGALTRDEVDAVEIRDADERVVARSDVPAVTASG